MSMSESEHEDRSIVSLVQVIDFHFFWWTQGGRLWTKSVELGFDKE